MHTPTAVPIASGATGRVVRQYDAERGCEIALKLLHHDDPLWVQRMLREAEVQMRLAHPHICEVYRTGRMGEQPYIAMRLVEGETLDRATRGLPDRDKAALLAQVADAIAYAHSQGAVHRDLKPSNIMVEMRAEGPHAVLVDFGLVRDVGASDLTRTGQVLGTPGYMAPEQASAAATVDGRADIYSLGVVAFELFAGRRPFLGDNAVEVLIQTLRSEPPSLASLRPDLDPALCRIVRQCLETDPDWRYPNASELRDDLLAFRDGRRVLARQDTGLRRTRRFVRRHPWRAGLGTTAVLLLAGLLGTALHSVWYARQESLAAQRYMEFAASIEAAIRLEYMKPAHDVSAVRARLHRQVERFAEELPSSGPAALRTGQFALGRAHLALGELAAAREGLERAAEQGEDSEQLSQALGQVLLAQYFDALRASAAIEEEELREQAIGALDADFRSPARRWLQRAARGDSAEAGQMRALLAYLDGEAERAAVALGEAAQQLAYPVDALLMAGELIAAEGLRAGLAGDTSAALAHWRRAVGNFRQAVDVARSHPLAAAALCRSGGEFVTLQRHGAALDDDEYQELLTQCDAAIALNPTIAATHAAKAQALADLGLLRRQRGRWSGADFAPAIEAARHALSLAPGSVPGQRALGALLTQRAYWLAENGDVESQTVAGEAVILLQTAHAQESDSPHGAMMLANAHLAAARAAVVAGSSGDAGMIEAERVLDRAAAGQEAPVVLEAHIIDTKTWRGFEAYMAGREAGEVLEEALMRAERLRQRAPDHPRVDPVLGMAAWSLADYRRQTGGERGRELQLAVDAFRRVVASEDAGFSSLFNATSVLHDFAEWRVTRGIRIRAELEELQDWTDRLASVAGEDHPIDIQHAGHAYLQALDAELAGADPWIHSRSARSRIDAALGNPIDAREAATMLARLAVAEWRWRAEDGGLPAGDELLRLDAVISRFPDLAVLKCETARLLLAMPATPDRVRRAGELFEQAIRQIPLLARGYRDLRERFPQLAERHD